MKILIDLQCCQTEAGKRGIGRYSLDLARELVRIGRGHDFLFLVNRTYLHQSRDFLAEVQDFAALSDIAYYDYPDVQKGRPERLVREAAANILRIDQIQSLSPDVFHVSSLFEGESIFGPAAAFTGVPKGPIISSATLYDLIPLIYPDRYMTDWQFVDWYQRTLASVRHLDLVLAISDATKQDVERFLRCDPSKVVNIRGSVGDRFRILEKGDRRKTALWSRFRSTRPFILYVSGPDPRKNLTGTLKAFAQVNRRSGGMLDLMVVHDIAGEDRSDLENLLVSLKIKERVFFTGFISDDELIEAYNDCKLSIFPSLYEGLGLPVIEAMKCGAPVLVGDNSSLKEIVPDPAYRFDASDIGSIADAILNVVGDDRTLDVMRRYSAVQARQFTWEKTATSTLEAWEHRYRERAATRSGASRPTLKIAMFTPLPPQKTGIADYSADLIPALTLQAPIDVFVNDVTHLPLAFGGARIHHHSEFPALSETYDVVVYQLGNSPYHHYMLPYVGRFPGVVVMHDIYLGHLSHDPGNPTEFLRQVIADHGSPARSIVIESPTVPEAASALIRRLTCCPTHVRRSLGIILHSKFAHDVIRRDCRQAAIPEVAIVPQFVRPIDRTDGGDRNPIRDRLNLPRGKTIVGSFGHASSTKGILELIAGFDRSRLGASGEALLLLVGELEGGPDHATPFSKRLVEVLRSRTDIVVTGFVDQADYDRYLACVDFAIQLRTITRGETSRAIQSMIVNGIPFLYNRLGFTHELPRDVGLPVDSLNAADIAAAIDALHSDESLVRRIGRAMETYATEALSPEAVGTRYIQALQSMMARAKRSGSKRFTAEIGKLARIEGLDGPLVDAVSTSYLNQRKAKEGPRYLIDVSHIRDVDAKTGIQRVVKEITRFAYHRDDIDMNPQTFSFTADGLTYADDFAIRCGAKLEVERPDERSGALDLRPFDKMLLADGTFHLSGWMKDPLDRLNQLAGEAYALVHDILPLQYPEYFPDHVHVSFTNWFEVVLAKASGLICTSKTSADLLIDYVEKNGIPVRPGLRLGISHLGADGAFDESDNLEKSLDVIDLVKKKNLFICVGTIEPRKGHIYVLDAFERLWAEGVDANLVFVGSRGWNIEGLLSRIDGHPERGRRFHVLGFVSDEDLRTLYRKAFATIMASVAEGFGLPIYEAAHHGSPLLLSDLDVFKEIAGDNAVYFKMNSAKDLYDKIKIVIGDQKYLKDSLKIEPSSWKDCAKRIYGIMNGQCTYHEF